MTKVEVESVVRDIEFQSKCRKCKTDTCHKVLTMVNESEYIEIEDCFQLFHRYMTVQCQGCKTVGFCRSTVDEDPRFEDVYDEIYYPSL